MRGWSLARVVDRDSEWTTNPVIYDRWVSERPEASFAGNDTRESGPLQHAHTGSENRNLLDLQAVSRAQTPLRPMNIARSKAVESDP